jgi:ABC-type multidrug transport system permease subunit
MRFVWSTFVKDWRRRWRNPLEILVWVGIPLIVGLLIALAFGGKGGPRPQAHVLVADRDDSFLSGLLVGAMSQEAAGGFIRAERVEEREGRARMEKGEATALVVIPKGFSRAVLREEPAVLALVTNPSKAILPGMVEEGLSILVDGMFYVHRLVGDDLRGFADGPPAGADTFDDATIAAFSTKMNRLAAELKGYLSPPLLRLETSVDQKEGDDLPMGLLLIPSILFMALLFMAQGMSDDMWEERTRRTLRRVITSPQPVSAFLAGKTLSAAALVFIVSVVALSLGYGYLGMNPGTLPAAALWATLSGTMFAAAMMTLQLFASSQRAGNIVSLAVVFPLMMAGGSFFPFETMPPWMAGIGKRTPNGWALQQLKEIVTGRAGAADLAVPVVMAAAVIVVLLWTCSRRLKGGFAQG